MQKNTAELGFMTAGTEQNKRVTARTGNWDSYVFQQTEIEDELKEKNSHYIKQRYFF